MHLLTAVSNGLSENWISLMFRNYMHKKTSYSWDVNVFYVLDYFIIVEIDLNKTYFTGIREIEVLHVFLCMQKRLHSVRRFC